MPTSARRYSSTRAIARAEWVLTACAVAWLQVIGVVTESVIHHVLHAIPIAVFLFLPRSTWVRHTASLAGFAWVFMLSFVTPMIRDVLTDGIVFVDRQHAYTWLAPVMLLISAAWSGLNAALLTGRPKRWALYALALLVIGVLLAHAPPWMRQLIELPLQRALEGRLLWVLIVVVEVPFVLALPWVLVRRLTQRPWPRLTSAVAAWQVAYWLTFLACMVVGMLPTLN